MNITYIMILLYVAAILMTFVGIGILLYSHREPAEIVLQITVPAEAIPLLHKYTGATITSFTLEKGKMYRIFDQVVKCEDLPMVLQEQMDTGLFTGVTIIPVGVVRWIDKSEDSIDGGEK